MILTPAELEQRCESHLFHLCRTIADRSVGSEGNRQSTDFVASEFAKYGWSVQCPEFDVVDWQEHGATLTIGDLQINPLVSPYTLGCEAEAELIAISTIEELRQEDIKDKIVLLHGSIAKEQIMPKNFLFYNPEEHREIVSLLEKGKPRALITATGRNAALAGGVYPFPLFEDGDFDIPSVYLTEDDGMQLLELEGRKAKLVSHSTRIPSKACNVIARKGRSKERIVVTAHIDAKKGAPGAIDNATGVIVLLLLAEILNDYAKDKTIELVAFNGEDYYSAPGQMHYIKQLDGKFDLIELNINIDGAGYKVGGSCFSFFNLDNLWQQQINSVLSSHPQISEGIPWYQGDHSIFVQQGRPAVAVTSAWFLENLETQDITHTEKDDIDIVNCQQVADIAQALYELVLPA